ncbi:MULTISPECIES: hypothetical protein [Streptomyces]|uniref:Lipoprotein n=1 Tax=Streptomyces griseiscabiei TaxID=2993540 RepID=A0ABU4L1Z9_9ACTN|nr:MULTISPECIES: hypothetical protein [Streptomyces]MBZ3906041.1 hypothetical protein [Streptomyces griseiscabiei]MDX2909674.1 hypothetical protein [Streptomyces griseiscabiei]
MAPRKATGRCASALLTAVLATGVLTGCELADAASGSGCDGTGSRVGELKAYGVLDARPQGTVVPKGFESLDAGCWADSGEAWLYAERTYVFPGDKAEVTRFYKAAAEREGWRLSRAGEKSSKKDPAANLCFTLGEKDDSTILDVYFLTKTILEDEESEPGPEFDTGVGYRVSVTSTADGSATSC